MHMHDHFAFLRANADSGPRLSVFARSALELHSTQVCTSANPTRQLRTAFKPMVLCAGSSVPFLVHATPLLARLRVSLPAAC